MKRILITGGAGFLGSHLCKSLMDEHEILLIDNFLTGRRENVPCHKNVKLIEGSIGCTAFTDACFQSFMPDVVFHAAASYASPLDFHSDSINNVVGTVNIVNMCKKYNVKKILYLQTSLCYGKPMTTPIKIGHPLFAGEYDAMSSYASTKTCAEQFIKLSGIPFVVFRLANMIGEANYSGAISSFHKNIKENKKITIVDARRDFLYYKNLVDLVELTFLPEHFEKTGYFHVSSGTDYSIKEIFDTMIEIMGVNRPKDVEIIPLGNDDVPTILLDNSLTKETFGWEPKYLDMKLNLLNAIKHYEKYPVITSHTHLKLK